MDNIMYSPSGLVSLQISNDKMSAWMVIKKADKLVGEQEILDLIDQAGICYGFEDALDWIAEQGIQKDYDKPFPVAMCKPSSGEQKLNLHFDPVNTYSPDQPWSFEDIKNWTFLSEGTVLADLSFNLFTAGGSVYNIFGELTSSSVSGHDLSGICGENVSYLAEKNSLIAQVTGYPYQDKEGKIHIVDSLVYNGNLSNLSQPLSLASSLVINGSIINSSLIALKDIIVNGDIEASQVYTEGSLTVTGKITSCQPGGVTVLKDLVVQSIMTSIVIVKGTLKFAYGITGSRVVAEGGISGDYDHSSIIGSQIQTSVSIDIASAGNNDGIDTELEICISPFIKERMTQQTKALVRLKEFPDLNADRIEDINLELNQMEKQLAADLNVFLDTRNDTRRYIITHRDIYPGVYIRILKKSFTIKGYQEYSEFTED
jgi:hypothetical protein